MENKQASSIPSEKDDLAYTWLADNTKLIGELNPGDDPEQYRSILLKMVFEGQEQLAEANAEDPFLFSHLLLLSAEAQVDLALVEKPASMARQVLLTEGCQRCQRAVTFLQEQKLSGLACQVLPKALIILAGAHQASTSGQQPEVEGLLKQAADQLDEFKLQQASERQLAVGKMLEGRVLALSAGEMANTKDRRQVLEKAGANLRQAAGLAGLAFDAELTRQAEEILAEVEKSLALACLPTPVVPASRSASQPERMVEEPTQPKLHPWILVVESDLVDPRRFTMAGRLTIGRAPENDLVCLDPQASRRHAMVVPEGDSYELTDLDSNNGTMVNGVRITRSILLAPGDLLQIGITRMRILGPAGTAPLHLDEPTVSASPPIGGKTAGLQPADVNHCPHCGSEIHPTTRFCGVCGKPVNETPAQRLCPHCGGPVRLGVKFCRECGGKVED